MNGFGYFCVATSFFLLVGCASVLPEQQTIVDENATMVYLEENLEPEALLFPAYLLGRDVELGQHGRIPGTNLIGAGMQVKRPLRVVHRELMVALEEHGWIVDAIEDDRQSFRIMASLGDENLELRGVQGSGSTHIFVLYTPAPVESLGR